MRASQAVSEINKLRVINTHRGSEFLPLRHAVWTDANSRRRRLKSSRKARQFEGSEASLSQAVQQQIYTFPDCWAIYILETVDCLWFFGGCD